MSTEIEDTLRQVRLAEVQNMTRQQKERWLISHGWRKDGGSYTNRWRARNDFVASFANAVRLQVLSGEETPT